MTSGRLSARHFPATLTLVCHWLCPWCLQIYPNPSINDEVYRRKEVYSCTSFLVTEWRPLTDRHVRPVLDLPLRHYNTFTFSVRNTWTSRFATIQGIASRSWRHSMYGSQRVIFALLSATTKTSMPIHFIINSHSWSPLTKLEIL